MGKQVGELQKVLTKFYNNSSKVSKFRRVKNYIFIKTIVDQMKREVVLSENPQRIISLVPSQTELLYDLGLGDRVVGITKFCIHPSKWRKVKTIIGGTKNFRFDVIDKLKPDLIIGNKEENYKEGIGKLSDKYPVWMSDIFSLDDSLSMMKQIGEITNTQHEASLLIDKISLGFNTIPKFKNKTVAYLIWNDPYMVVGSNTFINNILSQLGFANVFKNNDRYFTTTIEELIALNVDYIFLSSEPYPFKEKHLNKMCNLCPNSIVKIVDGEMFSWYGSRLLKSPMYFKGLYEEITH